MMKSANQEIFELSHGELVAWVDPGAAVHLKVVTPQGDPVELNAEEVRALCEALQKLVARKSNERSSSITWTRIREAWDEYRRQ